MRRLRPGEVLSVVPAVNVWNEDEYITAERAMNGRAAVFMVRRMVEL